MPKTGKISRIAFIVFVGVVLLVIVDRAYVFNIAAYSIDKKSANAKVESRDNEGAHSPMLAVIADLEDLVEAHEKTLIVIGTICIAWFTATLWEATRGLYVLAGTQARDMKRSLKTADRSAAAMEKVAGATANNAILMQGMLQKQMRAYVHVNIGAIAQTTDTVFQGVPELHNSGLTPARNVSFEIDARIYDAPVPRDFNFPIPFTVRDSEMSMSPRQSFTAHSPVLPRLGLSEAEAIFLGATRRLYVWGTIRYDDIFGDGHETEFCYSVAFTRDERGVIQTFGHFHPTHNKAT